MTPDYIPALRPDLLAATIPNVVYGGGAVSDSATTLFLWRSVATEQAKGGVLGFYLDDWRLSPLWKHPTRYAQQFVACGIKAVVEVDFSLWREMSLEEQRYNIYRQRTVSRVFQGYGLSVIPNLNWSTEESFAFCFSGIPVGAPVVACECRTPGGNDDDRRAFLRGLAEGVAVVKPQHVVIYGGTTHAYWLKSELPHGPIYHLIDDFMTARGRVRKAHERQARDRNQLTLAMGGNNIWVDEGPQAA